MEVFCPRCGAETRGYGPRKLCRACYTEEHDLVNLPGRIEVERCRHCGSVKTGMAWTEAEDAEGFVLAVLEYELAEHGVVEALRFRQDEEDETVFHVMLLVEEDVEGARMQQEVATTIVVEPTQCPTCAKFHGGYYTYTIQIRGEHTEEALERVMGRAATVTEEDREDFVADVEEVRGGFDVYCSTRAMAEELLSVLKAHYDVTEQRSRELVGEDDGQRVYRTTISARIQ